jgi:DNA-directed RNA polymerase subunit RPC12/RpoP
MPSCPKCGAALSIGEVKCPACGADVPQEKEDITKEEWFSSIILEPGETVLKSWRGDHEVSAMVTVRGIPQQAKTRKSGYLVLTNRKILFVEERGFFQTSYHVSITIKLEDIEGISMGGVVSKYVSLSDEHGENIFHLGGVSNEQLFASFKDLIEKQIEERRKELEAEKNKVIVNIDFEELKQYMERGGLTLKTFKCPQCSAPLSLPDSGNSVKCPYCGSTVLANDVFERVKMLIG